MKNSKQFASIFTIPSLTEGVELTVGEGVELTVGEGVELTVGESVGLTVGPEGGGGLGHFPGLLIPHTVHILSVWMLSLSGVRLASSSKPALIAQHSSL